MELKIQHEISISIYLILEEEFLANYTMNGWDEAIYDLKEAEIPDITVPDSFDWRDHGN